MKKLLLLGWISLWTLGVPGQTYIPYVDFNNARTFVMEADRHVYDVAGTPLVGTQYRAQLYFGRDAESLQPVTAAPASFRDPATIVGLPSLAGTWVGGARVLTGFAQGELAILQVRAWDSTTGADYTSAAVRGASATFTYRLPAAGGTPGAEYIENFRSFGLVPEPSTVGLVMVGAGVLLMLWPRRRFSGRYRVSEWESDVSGVER